ncbi:hypothetical protein [Elioraea tepidiphila]|jgi:hypothetical protein|uniref:hypothetical protein n=1 Tax=Elioraea tepidiphila TaxID=457934 RepID=UPI002FDABB71
MSKLGAFGRLAASKPAPDTDATTSRRRDAATPRNRGDGETVALTIRLGRADWMRLHELALHERVALAELIRRGLDRELRERGLPGLEWRP